MLCVKNTALLHTHIYIHIYKDMCVYIYVLSKNYSVNGFSVAIPSWLEVGGCLIYFGLATKVQTAS